jgi:hypothetical protein
MKMVGTDLSIFLTFFKTVRLTDKKLGLFPVKAEFRSMLPNLSAASMLAHLMGAAGSMLTKATVACWLLRSH